MNAPSIPAGETTSGFYFLNVPVDREVDIVPINIVPINIVPKYKLLFTETREYKISLDKLTAPTQKKIQAGKKDNILENYLIKLKQSIGSESTSAGPAPVSLKSAAKKIGKMTLEN